MSQTDPGVQSRAVNRRTVMKGTAWAVPAVMVGTALPAMAASKPKGLNGWVVLSRSCRRSTNTYTLTIDGRGSFTNGGANDRGIWVFVDDPNATLTNASIIFFFPILLGVLSFTNGSQSGWTNLTQVTSDKTGYYAYQTTYSGAWTYNATQTAWVANSDPYFTASGGGCPTITSYARRAVTVNGFPISFDRGPVNL